MVVFPLKLLPWLLVLGGIGCFMGGEDILLGVVMLIGGGVWIYFQLTGKSKRSSKGTSSPVSPSPPVPVPAPEPPKPTVSAFCPQCGAKTESGMLFCVQCGTRLH